MSGRGKPLRARVRLAHPGFALDVDLDLPGAGVTAVQGPSGAGKTTLLRAIAGLERAAGGRVEAAGQVWQDDAGGVWVPPHRRPLGYVFQEASLFSHLDVRGNLDYGRRRRSHDPAGAAAVEDAIAMLEIGALHAATASDPFDQEKQQHKAKGRGWWLAGMSTHSRSCWPIRSSMPSAQMR